MSNIRYIVSEYSMIALIGFGTRLLGLNALCTYAVLGDRHDLRPMYQALSGCRSVLSNLCQPVRGVDVS